jgi:hypothetical protein
MQTEQPLLASGNCVRASACVCMCCHARVCSQVHASKSVWASASAWPCLPSQYTKRNKAKTGWRISSPKTGLFRNSQLYAYPTRLTHSTRLFEASERYVNGRLSATPFPFSAYSGIGAGATFLFSSIIYIEGGLCQHTKFCGSKEDFPGGHRVHSELRGVDAALLQEGERELRGEVQGNGNTRIVCGRRSSASEVYLPTYLPTYLPPPPTPPSPLPPSHGISIYYLHPSLHLHLHACMHACIQPSIHPAIRFLLLPLALDLDPHPTTTSSTTSTSTTTTPPL